MKNHLKKLLPVLICSTYFISNNALAILVYDPTNWFENAATAANTSAQLVNSAQQLQLAFRDIQNYNGNVGQWSNIQNLLMQLGGQVQQGQSLAYSMQNLDGQFQTKFPGYTPSQNYQQAYSGWSQTSLDTLRGTLESAGMQANQFNNEQSELNALKVLSQTAQGRMQAVQVGNMLAMQEVTQLEQLRQLTIAQIDAQNTYAAAQVQQQASTEAATSNWIANGDTKFPTYGQQEKPNFSLLPQL